MPFRFRDFSTAELQRRVRNPGALRGHTDRRPVILRDEPTDRNTDTITKVQSSLLIRMRLFV